MYYKYINSIKDLPNPYKDSIYPNYRILTNKEFTDNTEFYIMGVVRILRNNTEWFIPIRKVYIAQSKDLFEKNKKIIIDLYNKEAELIINKYRVDGIKNIDNEILNKLSPHTLIYKLRNKQNNMLAVYVKMDVDPFGLEKGDWLYYNPDTELYELENSYRKETEYSIEEGKNKIGLSSDMILPLIENKVLITIQVDEDEE